MRAFAIWAATRHCRSTERTPLRSADHVDPTAKRDAVLLAMRYILALRRHIGAWRFRSFDIVDFNQTMEQARI
jgi:hypothetical protein